MFTVEPFYYIKYSGIFVTATNGATHIRTVFFSFVFKGMIGLFSLLIFHIKTQHPICADFKILQINEKHEKQQMLIQALKKAPALINFTVTPSRLPS